MTFRQEKTEAVNLAKRLFQAAYGRIHKKDICLLEMGSDGYGIDYVLFRNDFTGRDYRITGTPILNDYVIDEVYFEG